MTIEEHNTSFNLQKANCIDWDTDTCQYIYNDGTFSCPQVIQFPPSWGEKVVKLLYQQHIVDVLTEKLPEDCINNNETIVHTSYDIKDYMHIFRSLGQALITLGEILSDQEEIQPFEVVLEKLLYHCIKNWYRNIHQLSRSEVDSRIILSEYYIMDLQNDESSRDIRNVQNELLALPEAVTNGWFSLDYKL